MIIEELVAVLGFRLDGEDAVKRFRSHLDGVREKLTTVVAVARGAAIAAFASISGSMTGAGISAVMTGVQFENLGIVLETIEGSSQKAKASLAWVSDFAAKTPYDLAGVSEAFVALKAYGLDPMDGTLKDLGDAAAAMNKPLMQAVEAIADASTGEFERLKEFGIRASVDKKTKDVTLSWVKDHKEMTKTVTNDAAELQKAVTEIFGSRFSGAMDRLSLGLSGMFSNLGDMWTRFQMKINDAGWYRWIKAQTKELLDWINALDGDGTLDRWAGRISRNLIAVGEALKHAGLMVLELMKWFDRLPDSVKKTVASIGGLVFALLFPWLTVLGLIVLALDDVWTYLQGGESYTGDFIAKLKELFGVSEDTAKWILGIAAAIGALLILKPGLAIRAFITALKVGFKALKWSTIITKVPWAKIIGAVPWKDFLKSPLWRSIILRPAASLFLPIAKEVIDGMAAIGKRAAAAFLAGLGSPAAAAGAGLAIVGASIYAQQTDEGQAYLKSKIARIQKEGLLPDSFGQAAKDIFGIDDLKMWGEIIKNRLPSFSDPANSPIANPGSLLPPGQANVTTNSNNTTTVNGGPVSVQVQTGASPQAIGAEVAAAQSRALAATLPASVKAGPR